MGDCGVAGVVLKAGEPVHAYKILRYMLHGLQHRGQLSCGVTLLGPDKTTLINHKGIGLVDQVLNGQSLEGLLGIGHVRYGTSGIASEGTPLNGDALRRYYDHVLEESQPFHYRSANPHYEFSFAFNGQLTNDAELRNYFSTKKGYRFKTSTDTEVLMHVIAEELQKNPELTPPDLKDVFSRVVDRIDGAYNIVFMDGAGRFAAIRDPYGFHPLVYAQNNSLIAVASETNAFENIDTIDRSDIHFPQPGTLLLYDYPHNREFQEVSLRSPIHSACVLEMIYFMSIVSGYSENVSVHAVRTRMGEVMAEIEPLKQRSDFSEFLVVAVPDTAKTAAQSYADTLKLKFDQGGIVRDSHVGRAFIADPLRRGESLELKYGVVKDIVAGKKLVVFDDSIVRGDAARRTAIKLYKKAGASEVHFRFTFPPVTSSCHYGIDFPNPEKLITQQVGRYTSIPELEQKIATMLEVDSIKYPSVDLLLDAVSRVLDRSRDAFCTACITGRYPVPTPPR